MAKRSFRYNPETGEMEEISPSSSVPVTHMVMGDVPAFVSPIDGRVVEGRRQYYDHMKKHGVVPFEAGSEKRVHPPRLDPTPRREAIWEAVDRSIQRGRGRR